MKDFFERVKLSIWYKKYVDFQPKTNYLASDFIVQNKNDCIFHVRFYVYLQTIKVDFIVSFNVIVHEYSRERIVRESLYYYRRYFRDW